MKKIMSNILLFALILLAACSGQEKGELKRVDIQKANKEGNYEEVVMITDHESIELLKKLFEDIKWDDKEVNMARNPDVKATLFYEYDKNMPERLVEYEIGFHESSGTTTIVSSNENQSYGELDKDNTKTFRGILLK
ncbi:hypothetical protein NQ095_08305 [Rossellomorea sp. SC111]|uniref:hypothetical protein n=1 Tax=Rossellomorea sp. SC111 TaxID=2968985 RepID=UPI00215A7D9F|nr:hypothetical protein [Rossellomorea sp. SC111]MCR8848400.1 hypothetical protein [Rossellomorea sp. SC111]